MSANTVELLGILLVLAGVGLAVTAAALVSLVAALVTGAAFAVVIGVVVVVAANRAQVLRQAQARAAVSR
jgi:hypothetical protein